jgi:DNA-binding NarL/FixJ family response regulator
MGRHRSGERRYEFSILVADPDNRRRAALARPLALEGFRVSEAASSSELRARIAETAGQATTVDAVILGVGLAADEQAIAALITSVRQLTHAILLITSRQHFDLAIAGMKAGATILVTHPVRLSRLLVRLAMALVEHAPTGAVVGHKPPSSVLSPRQRMVAEMLVDGYSNKEIGRALMITERTVEAHRRNIMTRMGTDTFAEFVRAFLSAEPAKLTQA